SGSKASRPRAAGLPWDWGTNGAAASTVGSKLFPGRSFSEDQDKRPRILGHVDTETAVATENGGQGLGGGQIVVSDTSSWPVGARRKESAHYSGNDVLSFLPGSPQLCQGLALEQAQAQKQTEAGGLAGTLVQGGVGTLIVSVHGQWLVLGEYLFDQ